MKTLNNENEDSGFTTISALQAYSHDDVIVPVPIDTFVSQGKEERRAESSKPINDASGTKTKIVDEVPSLPDVVPALEKDAEVVPMNNANNSNSTDAIDNEKSNKFAYVFLVAGCDPTNPTYLGYIYNIIVAKRIFIERGSTTDVVVLIRMHLDSNHTELPPEHQELFEKGDVIVKYLPKPHVDNFHTAMMDKFRILTLTEYSRVIFLDSDVIPIYNLDYMFELSIGPDAKLEENVVLAYKAEPANGGFFMLKPDEDDYKDLMKTVEKTEAMGYNFNETLGFGKFQCCVICIMV